MMIGKPKRAKIRTRITLAYSAMCKMRTLHNENLIISSHKLLR